MIRAKIAQYAADPASLANNVRKLQGREGCRLRVGDWRVIFDETGDEPVVAAYPASVAEAVEGKRVTWAEAFFDLVVVLAITQVATLMGMTKQAASKLAGSIMDAGYLERGASSSDSRERPLRLSSRGALLLADVEQIYEELEARWADAIGAAALSRMRRDLTTAVAASHDGRLPAIRPM